ncbi:hypothetical protein ABE322_29715 [Priestia megaterium]
MVKSDDKFIDLKELLLQIEKLESILSEKNNSIHIDKLELVFNIETVDVKENSGTLNIGTTYNPQILKEEKSSNKKDKKKYKDGEIKVVVNGKEKDLIFEEGE